MLRTEHVKLRLQYMYNKVTKVGLQAKECDALRGDLVYVQRKNLLRVARHLDDGPGRRTLWYSRSC
jgi:hypothetical protein